MPRGGRRRGTPGQAYPNRSDMRGPGTPDIPKTFQGQPYGAATTQAQAQAATPASPPGNQPPGGAAPVSPPSMPPGGLGDFTRQTERPNEPITHGLPSGPGAGPEALGLTGRNDAVSLQLRALYQKFPIPEIAALLAET